MTVAVRSAGFLLGAAALSGCAVNVSRISVDAPGRMEGYEFVARTSSASNDLTRPMPRLLRAALRHCGLPNTDTARDSIRHSEAHGIYFDRWMDFACPAPAKDMK